MSYMKKISGYFFYWAVPLLMIIALFSSCVTQRQVKYLQQKQKADTSRSYVHHKPPDYRIQSHDFLYIRIFGMDEKTNSFFNKQEGTGGSVGVEYSDIGLYLNSYEVSDSGFIDFPAIGKIFVKDLRVDQIKLQVQSLVNEYLKDVTIVVKLVNFNVSLLGEVKHPGEIKVYKDKINIFEAISQAGDLTDFANRGKVALIRKTQEGSRVTYLDLNSVQILRSEYYYLRPNDILYVAPLGIKRWGTETFPWALIFSAITTTLLLINYFK